MNDIAIKVQGLGKKYIIGQLKSRDFRVSFGNKIKSFLGWNYSSPVEEEFWALEDINFEIKKGEALGIIGRNGAGKSTLLKILSRITEPTKGRFEINGRVSSLLEVGTGFHPELSGRENIYLNGTILGMRRIEIKQKLEEIIAFSGVEKFLDTPVKHYSSGMKVRLAFSVAAHLEPEILIVDEVLAVGDAEFQKKCLGKMGEVSKNEGRTVLFVSHNMAAVQNLCDWGILLENGSIRFSGSIGTAVTKYLTSGEENKNVLLDHKRKDRRGSGRLRLISYWFEDLKGNRLTGLQTGANAKILFKFNSSEESISQLVIRLKIFNNNKELVTILNNFHSGHPLELNSNKIVACVIHKLPLSAGKYSFDFQTMVGYEVADEIEDLGEVFVDMGDFFGTGKIPNFRNIQLTEHKWIIG